VPLVLGADYHESVEALRWLAALPLLRTVQYFGADALTGAGFQGSRTVGQLGIAALNILLCLWLLPLYSWRGAAWASLASDGALALTMWGLVWHTCARERERLSRRVWAPAAGGPA
jgi:O-antigen/teichoic acid export membrane protein